MKNKDRSQGGQRDQQGRDIGNQQGTTQTAGRNNAGQAQDNNRREGQGEGNQRSKGRQPVGGNRANPGLG